VYNPPVVAEARIEGQRSIGAGDRVARPVEALDDGLVDAWLSEDLAERDGVTGRVRAALARAPVHPVARSGAQGLN